jgi:hypothetical protein
VAGHESPSYFDANTLHPLTGIALLVLCKSKDLKIFREIKIPTLREGFPIVDSPHHCESSLHLQAVSLQTAGKESFGA